MSDLEQLLKNLNYSLKSQDIGLASWKGSHGPPQKMFIPTKDYLLNSTSKQQDAIKARNDMMEDYLEEQKTPIYRYDEYGDIIVGMDGNPIEYKFHGINPPELDLTTLRINFYDPVERKNINENLSLEDQKRILENKENIIKRTNESLDERIRRASEELEYHKQDLIIIDNNIKDIDDEIKEIYNYNTYPNRKKVVKNKKLEVRELLYQKKELVKAIEALNEFIKNGINEKEAYVEEINTLTTQIKNKLKENELKVETYNKELNTLNTGALNTSKQFNETDEEYFERLQQMADVPFADGRTEQKAFIREKEKLRDNLKLIIRDNATIGQITNFLYSENPQLIYEINKFFPGFKEYFIKKYGENNEKINYRDVVSEISLYLQRSTDPNVLRGGLPEQQQLIINPSYQSQIPISSQRPISTQQPISLQEPFEIPGDDEEEVIDFTEIYKKVPPPISGNVPTYLSGSDDESTNQIKVSLVKTNHIPDTLVLTSSKGKKLYIKMYVDDFKVKRKEGGLLQDREFKSPIFFLSNTGDPGTYNNMNYKQIIEKIAIFFDVSKSDVYELMGKRKDSRTYTKEDMELFLNSKGLIPTLSSPKILNTGTNLTIGYGIKHAENLPDKVNFGSNILFLKKLFLKNILSIQNKHNTKINGFNNVRVSDNFVKIIMNLIKNIDFTNNDLQNLSNGERVLLDNLLTLSELNKKFVTGSNINSLNQLKKEYEILIGEIEAGNNNELLKKKLYTLLMKFVHFGALSQSQALKQYKEIIKDYF